MGDTKIEWAERVWNPVRGCSPVSEGCRNCYAARFAHRFSGPGQPYEGLTRLTDSGPKWTGKVREVPEMLIEPLGTKKPSTFFVNSMSDLFHDDVSEAFIDRVIEVMMACPQHLFLVLTKRPHNLEQKLYGITGRILIRVLGGGDYVPNLWLGVSVENQQAADERIPQLFSVPAALYWVSMEPLLGKIDIEDWLMPTCRLCKGSMSIPVSGGGIPCNRCLDHQGIDPMRLGWVVCGGESGYGARPMDVAWVDSIRKQCQVAGVPFFFKHWGMFDEMGNKVGKKKSGRKLDGKTWDESPLIR